MTILPKDLEIKLRDTPAVPLSHRELAVVVIDMQPKFLNKFDSGITKELILHQVGALEYFSQANVPILVVEYSGYGRTINPIRDIARGSFNHDPFKKDYDNAFGYLYMNCVLWEMDVKKVFLMGVAASACIFGSALGARKNGFDVSAAENVIANQGDTINFRTDRGRNLFLAAELNYHSSHLDFIKSLSKE